MVAKLHVDAVALELIAKPHFVKYAKVTLKSRF
jgi:hypothetical protein